MGIAKALPMCFDQFKADIVIDKESKDVYNKPYLAFRVASKDHDIIYEDTKPLF